MERQPEQRRRAFGRLVDRLVRGRDLSREETRDAWLRICREEPSDLQQGAFIAALKAKPETPEEIAGTFDALYESDTVRVELDSEGPLVDNCGTGADTLETFNVSTGAAIVAAACGARVVRHAARAISSRCGSVDVVEALGVDVESAPEVPKQSIERAGIGVWNALLPEIHPRTLGRILSQVRFGSTINLVGPLLNPTMPTHKVLGVPSPGMIDVMGRVLRELGIRAGFVVHGLEHGSSRGMDELSTLGPSHVLELREDGGLERYQVTPEELGLETASYRDVASADDVEEDALALLRVLTGSDAGPRSDIVCLNAAPILRVVGLAPDLRSGIERARRAIAGGRAVEKLREWVRWQNRRPEDGLPRLERLLRRAG